MCHRTHVQQVLHEPHKLRTSLLGLCDATPVLVSPEHTVSHAYTKSSSLSSSLPTHVGAPSHRGLLDAAPLAARVRGCSQVVQHDSDPALCTVHAAQTQSAGGVALRRLLHATQTLSPSSFSMVHVVHVQPDAELDSVLEAVLEAVLDAVLDAVLGAVFLAAGGAGVAAVPGVGRRGLLPPFASIFSAVRRSSGLVVLAMTAKQRRSTALWLGGCSDIGDHWEEGADASGAAGNRRAGSRVVSAVSATKGGRYLDSNNPLSSHRHGLLAAPPACQRRLALQRAGRLA